MPPEPAGSDTYRTIAAPVDAEREIQRSRFLTRLVRVESETEARAVIAAVRAEHPKARHHCTAFVLGADARTQRSNDDGEPSGTAGAPMLDALLSAGLSDVIAVVTRYFGGILLGAGGLTRAYRAAVAQAVADAEIQIRERLTPVSVTSDYATAPTIEAEARRRGITVGDASYTDAVTQTYFARHAEIAELKALVAEASGGVAAVELGDPRFVDRPGSSDFGA